MCSEPTNSKHVVFQAIVAPKVLLALVCISLLLHLHQNFGADKYFRMKSFIQPNMNSNIITEKIGSTNATMTIKETSTTIVGDANNCKEQTSLYFLKIHKAGSTTVQNLFWRFGVTRSLSIMVFKGRFPYPSRDFRPILLPDPKIETFDGRYDIFCEHSIFNDKQLKSKMKEDTEYIAILREPLSKLRSALEFFHYVGPTQPASWNKSGRCRTLPYVNKDRCLSSIC